MAVVVGVAAYLGLGPLTGAGPWAEPTRRDRGGVDRMPTAPPLARSRNAPFIPTLGDGRFTRPSGRGTRPVGRGQLLRYVVEVEGGPRQDPADFARRVDAVLGDRQGWTGGGRWAFQRVTSGTYDFVVRLASPGTVDRLCGAAGLKTEGEVNCSAGKQVVVNLKRWLLLTTFYQGQPDEYHALVINHEVGHRLGFGHVTCSGKGRLAPVMQQQIFGMRGCRINGRPYDRRGRLITAPQVP
jgi:Protein of unknown function (DUF3152)